MDKVDTIEVVKTFVLANILKGHYSHINNFYDYKVIYERQKKEVDSYSQKKLWRMVTYEKRLKRFKELNWYFGKVDLRKVGIWPNMGGIKEGLIIKGSKWSAKKIYKSSGEIACGELNHLFRILPLSPFLNKHVPIIVVEGGLIRKRNPKLEREKYDIEDGSHRSICLGLLGKTYANAFIGSNK